MLFDTRYILLVTIVLTQYVSAFDEGSGTWAIKFHPSRVEKLEEFNTTEIEVTIVPPDSMSEDQLNDLKVGLRSDNTDLFSLQFENQDETITQEIVCDLTRVELNGNWTFTFNLTAKFLGFSKVVAEVRHGDEVVARRRLPVSVVRMKTIESKVFTYSVALLVSLAYINMGCAIDLTIIKEVIKRPIGPAIGFICQFVLMPLISFGLGYIYPPAESTMRLGLFVTGASPGGGASNIWTLMFGGNLNLSITMTVISTFSAFFMMPLWLFTLGNVIFDETEIQIPYHKICMTAMCLVIPITIGLAIARYLPRVSKFLVKILKPMALFLILFIVLFGIWANLYIFKLMSWRVFLTGMGLPWLGFAFGYMTARICHRSPEDVIAIAIETGIQNTGVSIFILWFTLDQPAGDMTAVVPVAAATMTPIPLLMCLIFIKLRQCWAKRYGHHYEPPLNQNELKEGMKMKSIENGEKVNGHEKNGLQTNGHKTNGHESNGHQTIILSANGHHSNGHLTN